MKVFLPNVLKSALVCLCLRVALPADGQLALRVLHSFGGGADGQQPYAGLAQAGDGALYGTTFQGGSNNAGVLFVIHPDGAAQAPIFGFPASSLDPGGVANPSGLTQGADGALYGTTGFGGTSQYGSVFKVNTDGTGYLVLHSFSSSFGGPYEPTASLVQGQDGLLYGTTQGGGVMGAGAVFSVSTNGVDYSTLHQFGVQTDGRGPQAPLIQGKDGALYGTTSQGGASVLAGGSGLGTVFRLATDGTETVLHSFLGTGGDGQYPYSAGLVQGKDGTLYGTTQQGGATANGPNTGFGTLYKLNPDGTGFAVLHSFGASADGRYPNSTLVLGMDDALYGITEYGGSNNVGVVFRLNPHGGQYEVLYHFGSAPGDGAYPGSALVQASDGGFFGTTKLGGQNNLGTVFRVGPAPPVISSLVPLPDKTVQLTVNAASNFLFRVEATSDHKQWETLTNILNAGSRFQVIDLGASNAPSRFYRAAWVP